jgi:RimJ/RimL family protein N-acetyltransferase
VDFSSYSAETARMWLRPYAFSDFDSCLDLWSREDVVRYVPWPPRDATATRRALGRHQAMVLEKDDDAITLAGIDKETGRLVGEFVLFLRSVEHRCAEIGYLLHPDFQRRGLATEGSRHLLEMAFVLMDLRRVVARLDARNTASAAVLRRLGMRHEAHLVENELFKGEWSDEDQFALLRREWEARGDLRP